MTNSGCTTPFEGVGTPRGNAWVLRLNGGSSSIKFALYQASTPLKRGLHGMVDRIGLHGTVLAHTDEEGVPQPRLALTASDQDSPVGFLIDWLEKQTRLESIRAVGHRVVHGMNPLGVLALRLGQTEVLGAHLPAAASTRAINLGAIWSKGRMKSTSPVLIAVSGMLKS